MSTRQVFLALDKLRDAGILGCAFSGGEIFLREDILDILTYAIKKDFFFFYLMSNGTVCTRRHLDFIIEHRDYIRTFTMSVFSHVPEVNDRVFGVDNALERIRDTGSYLQKHGVVVKFNLNVLESTLDTFLETKRFFAEKGYYIEYYYPPVTVFPECSAHCFSPYYHEQFYQQFLCRLSSEERRALRNRLLTPGKSDSLCNGIQTLVTIDNRAHIKPCIAFFGMTMGNILDAGSLTDILQRSPEYRRLKSLTKQDISVCRDCRLRNLCSPCLGKLWSIDPHFCSPVPGYCIAMRLLYDYEENGERGMQ